MGISAPDQGKTELVFVQEQIYLHRNGSRDVSIDFLVKNTGMSEIRRFRIELPCRLLTEQQSTRSAADDSQEKLYRRLCNEQCKRVKIGTSKLTAQDADNNWIYKTLPHIRFLDYDGRTGYLRAKRDENDVMLKGLIKHDWEIGVSEELGDDPWRWFACYVNGITVFDFAVSSNKQKEFLRPGESMWISIEFKVPRGGMQYVQLESLWRRLLARKRSFPVILMSPRAFLEWKSNQLTIFERRTQPEEADQRVAVAYVRKALGSPAMAEISDWRLFLHWSRRLSIVRTKISGDILEPPTDHLLHGGKKRWFSFKKNPPSPDSEHRSEFWFGSYHKCAEPPGGICIELKAVIDNLLYNYLFPWLGFIGFLLGIISISLAFYRWFRFLHFGSG